MNHSFFVKLKMLKVDDFFSFIKLLIALPLTLFFRFKIKDLWLICESENEARDNAYWLFKFLNKEHPEINVMYAINYNSPDYDKVNTLGKTCQFGSIMHWVYYLIAKNNISTHKGGKPNAAICYVLEVYGLLKNRRIFLQHGITYNDAEWLYYKNTKLRLFICGAQPEYEYVKNNFGYPSDNVKYVGFCRFDNLINTQKCNKKKRILVMPTWREWLVSHTDMTKELNYNGDFSTTQYYHAWMNLLNNKRLSLFLKQNDIELLFYPHRNMQPFLSLFKVESENVILADWKKYDIQDLLIQSDMMITDYSSVAFDYAFMKKPIVFYQFDYDFFRKGQYKEGYFDFGNQLLGRVCHQEVSVIDEIINIVENHYQIDEKQDHYINEFFPLRDNENCERTFRTISSLK